MIGRKWFMKQAEVPPISEVSVSVPNLTPIPTLSPRESPLSQNQTALKKIPSLHANSVGSSKGAYSPELHQKQLIEKGQVEVRIVNGLALAQGAILLGKLMESATTQQGQVPKAEILYWSSTEIPYVIQPEIPPSQKLKIEAALNYLKEKTPVHFVQYDGQTDAIVFEVGNEHCISALGKLGGLEPIRLDQNCGTHEVLHEVMHALGFRG